MFSRYLEPFFAPPDAAGAAASGAPAPAPVTPPAEPLADPATPAAAATGPDATLASASADPDDGDDFDDSEELATQLPEATIRTRHRRLQRFASQVRPLADRFRDARTGRLMSTADVDRVLSNSREFEELDRVLRADPDAVRAVITAQQRLQSGAPATPAAPTRVPFDEARFRAEWAYETDSVDGQRFYAQQLELKREVHEQRQDSAELRQLLRQVQQGSEQEAVGRVETDWKTLAGQAGKEVDETYRRMFVERIFFQFQLLRERGQLTKASAQQVIDEVLAPVRAAKARAARSTTTRQSQMVAGNATLPRVPRPGALTPATGQATTRETLDDARRSFLGRAR